MKKLAFTTGLAALLTAISCGKSPTGPEIGDRETRTSTEIVKISDRFDILDTEYNEERSQEIEGVRGGYPAFDIRPDTMSLNDKTHLLGFYVHGEVERKVEEVLEWNRGGFTGRLRQEIIQTKKEDLAGFYQRLQSDLDNVSEGGDYLRFGETHVGDFYRMDLPNVPESPDLLSRLDEVNNLPINWDIGFRQVYLANGDRSIATAESGERIIDGMEIYPRVQENAGYTGMGYDAIWAITGDDRWLDPQVRYPNMPKIELILTDSTDN